MVTLNDKYKNLGSDSRYFIVTGGRGSSKSFSVTSFLLLLTYEQGHVILFTRYTLVSAHISIIPEFIEKIELLGKEHDGNLWFELLRQVSPLHRILAEAPDDPSLN